MNFLKNFCAALLAVLFIATSSAAQNFGMFQLNAVRGQHLLGVYGGFNPTAIPTFEVWLGKNVSIITSNFDQTARSNGWTGSVGSQLTNYDSYSIKIVWGIGTTLPGETLAQCAAGNFDSDYHNALANIAFHRGPSNANEPPPYYIRLNWEFNGDWEPWSTIGVETDYINCWRHFWTLANDNYPGTFRFVWCPNEGGPLGAGPTEDPTLSYPGDSYVDVIAMDAYYNIVYNSSNPTTAFNNFLTDTYGFTWLASYGASHGKPIAFPEWGINVDPAGATYIHLFFNWMAAQNLMYQAYWEQTDTFNGLLQLNQYPSSATEFITDFGNLATAYLGAADVIAASDLAFPGISCWSLRSCYSGNRGQAVINVCDDTGANCADVVTSVTTGNLPTSIVRGSNNCTSSGTCRVPTIYDQFNAACTGGVGCHVVSASNAASPVLTPNCVNTTFWCLTFTTASVLVSTPSFTNTTAQPFMLNVVADRTTNNGNSSQIVNGNANSDIGYTNSTNTAFIYAGSTLTTSESDNAWHVLTGTYYDSSSLSALCVDNSCVTGSVSTNSISGQPYIGSNFTGNFVEAIDYNTNLTNTQQHNLCQNQHTFWATPTSCP